MLETATDAPLTVSDLVELIGVSPGRSTLRPGMRGWVMGTGLGWGAVSVAWCGRRRWSSPLRPVHRRRVAPSSGGPNAP